MSYSSDFFPATQRYLFKGWLRVSESISYLQALERFPGRLNVIVRDADAVAAQSAIARGWKRKKLRDEALHKTGTLTPDFLRTINVADRHFVQLPCDNHQIDNWKCQRMFLCRKSQLSACIDAEACLREQEFPSLRGYIVADAQCDLGASRLEWQAVAPPNLADLELQTPKGQHNPIRLSAADVAAIMAITHADS